VGLADAYASLRLEVGSAYTLVFFVMIVPLLIGIQLLARPLELGAKAARP
jgi:putative spermidine/putrescine transport system permease protein